VRSALLPFGLLLVAVLLGALLVRGGAPARQAHLLRRAGFVAMAVFAVLVGAFVIGETLDDPGGWRAVGLVAAWLVPLAVLAALAWRRPDLATWVLGGLTGVVVIGAVWFAVDPQAGRSLENDVGPVRALAVFVVSVVLGVLGLARTGLAAVLLLVVGLVPVLAGTLGRGGMSSLSAASLPALLTGVLYLASALAARGADDVTVGRR
jgi:hypothetical protein